MQQFLQYRDKVMMLPRLAEYAFTQTEAFTSRSMTCIPPKLPTN